MGRVEPGGGPQPLLLGRSISKGWRVANTGVYQIDREMWDHPFFKAEPYTEKQAWAWLIGQAAWRAETVSIGESGHRRTIQIERGRFAASFRVLAAKWLWTIGKVQRFSTRLRKENMIRYERISGVDVITICNYEEYQFGRFNGTTRIDSANDSDIDTTDRFTKSLLNKTLRKERKERQEDVEVNRIDDQRSTTQTQPNKPKQALLGPPSPPDPWLELKTKIIDIREQATGHYTDCHLVDLWKANSYEPEICGAVVLGILRTDGAKPLSYMANPLKKAHEEAWEARKKAVAPPPKREMNWAMHLATLKQIGEWPMALGPQPGSAGCRVPHQMQVEFGYLPARERISA